MLSNGHVPRQVARRFVQENQKGSGGGLNGKPQIATANICRRGAGDRSPNGTLRIWAFQRRRGDRNETTARTTRRRGMTMAQRLANPPVSLPRLRRLSPGPIAAGADKHEPALPNGQDEFDGHVANSRGQTSAGSIPRASDERSHACRHALDLGQAMGRHSRSAPAGTQKGAAFGCLLRLWPAHRNCPNRRTGPRPEVNSGPAIDPAKGPRPWARSQNRRLMPVQIWCSQAGLPKGDPLLDPCPPSRFSSTNVRSVSKAHPASRIFAALFEETLHPVHGLGLASRDRFGRSCVLPI